MAPTSLTKRCKPCDRELPLDQFRVIKSSGRLYSYCNDCKREQQRNWRKENRSVADAASRRHRARRAAFFSAEARMHRELVSDRYVKQQLNKEGIPSFLVTPPLIAATRARIELNRELKQKRKSA